MPYAKRAITCAHCDKTVTKRAPPEQIYCSRQCSSASRKKREIRICHTCGNTFEFRNSPGVKKNAGKYCSVECRIIGTRTGYHPCPECGKTVDSQSVYCSRKCSLIGRGKKRRTGKEVPCEWCGKVVYLPKARLKSAQYHFCSLEHQIAWQGRNKIEFACKICGQKFTWSPSRVAQTNPTYCSIACRNADPERRQQLLKMSRQQQNIHPTKPEQIGYSLLDELGLPYQPQYLINDKFCVDAFVPSHNLVIQIDGNYWHGHPEDFPELDNRQRKRIRYDKSQDAYMKVCGYHVVRIWGRELRQNLDSVRDSLLAALTQIEQNPSRLWSGHLVI